MTDFNDRERAEIRHARALCLAAAGKLSEAWPDYEERHNPSFAQATAFAIAVTHRLCTAYLPPIWGYFAIRWLGRHGYI